MNTLIYAGMINYPEATFECLITGNDLGNFFEWTSNLENVKFFNVYQTKVICSIKN